MRYGLLASAAVAVLSHVAAAETETPAADPQQTGRKPVALRAEAPDVLFLPGRPRYRKVFRGREDGRITGFAERREAWDIVWRPTP